MRNKRTDIELIDDVLSGDQSVYSELVKIHQSYVFSLAMRFTRKREDAEEVAQDTFVKAYRSLAQYKKESKFSTWLYTITYHTAMTHLRKKRPTTSSLDDDENLIQLESQSFDDENSAEKKSRSFYLNKAIGMLSPDDGVIITLFYKGEQSLEEIAKVMSMETNAVKVKLHRARHKLKIILETLLKDEVKELL